MKDLLRNIGFQPVKKGSLTTKLAKRHEGQKEKELFLKMMKAHKKCEVIKIIEICLPFLGFKPIILK